MGTEMRLAGRITDWNDEKGFGFVVPNGGGDRAFVHVNEFQRGSKRPVAGDLISYASVLDRRGRLNAKQVRHAGQKIAVPRPPSRVPRAALGGAALVFAAVLAFVGVVPFLLAAGIATLSFLAYFMYWLDKSAAQRRAQRTPESTLHLVSLLGGWPGALIAQQQFRHKTIKQPFQSVFWGTVVLSVVALVWLVTSGVAAELAQSLGG
ncbi:DUF1294 domain-containing protein [Alkalisalibacterium limincola]|uniref:DUF1294 domain-containing protein n=2 Tax=Alkalisalibacterium limincola TaxID=2699169 RepID=A0A5C8KKG7_9GAMM|nr:DUF1294 domain-containing protein [Alkalisalibacterium limincola]